MTMWNSTYIQVHPTEAVTIQAESEGGVNIELYLRGEHIDILRRTFEAEKITGHLGHAFWHAKNPERELPCKHGMCAKEDRK